MCLPILSSTSSPRSPRTPILVPNRRSLSSEDCDDDYFQQAGCASGTRVTIQSAASSIHEPDNCDLGDSSHFPNVLSVDEPQFVVPELWAFWMDSKLYSSSSSRLDLSPNRHSMMMRGQNHLLSEGQVSSTYPSSTRSPMVREES